MVVDVALVPAEIPENHQISNQAVLVIDVLRATSTIITALAAGATSVVPVEEAGEARKLAEALGDGVILAGERGGLPLPGFHLGNSPAEYSRKVVEGRVVVLTTTNGTYALRRVQAAKQVGVAAFLNAEAATKWACNALSQGINVLIVCAGTMRRFTWEDASLAGLLVTMIEEQLDGVKLSDGASAAKQIWKSAESPLEALRKSLHGTDLASLGFSADLEYCAGVSVFDMVPELHDARLVQGN